MTKENSYSQILKSSSIMGGAAGVNLLLSMVRVKFAAVMIGTAGVGLLNSFTAIQGLIGTLAGLGIQTSAVREVAAAVAKNDQLAIGRAVLTLRRVCWLTGIVGMLAMMLFSPLISELTFGSHQYTLDIAALGIIILLANLSDGQMALIQGMRQIGDMARAQVIGTALATGVAITLYSWLGLRGIVPSLIAVAFIQLILSWYFAKRVAVPPAVLSWRQTFSGASDMVKLGLVFMWNSLLLNMVIYLTIKLITNKLSLEAVGIYSAAFALSGVLINFVLNSMTADYFPRLTSVAKDKVAVNRMVNEQIEIGLLLVLPGLIAMMAFGPWILKLMYSSEFLPAAELMNWFLLGSFGRVLSWPAGFIMMAVGNWRWALFIETSFNIIYIIFIVVGIPMFGILGVGIAFFMMYIGYTIAIFLVARHITGFRWSLQSKKIVWFAMTLLMLTFVSVSYLAIWPATLLGVCISFVTSVYCLRGLIRRIGIHHRITRIALSIPGLRNICSFRI